MSHTVARDLTGTTEKIPEEELDRIFNLNVKGVSLCCQAEGRVMLAQGAGKIINTTSISATVVNHPNNNAHYNASKAAVLHLTKSLAAEWAKRGVRVNAVRVMLLISCCWWWWL